MYCCGLVVTYSGVQKSEICEYKEILELTFLQIPNQICDTDHANSLVQSDDFACIIAQDTRFT